MSRKEQNSLISNSITKYILCLTCSELVISSDFQYVDEYKYKIKTADPTHI